MHRQAIAKLHSHFVCAPFANAVEHSLCVWVCLGCHCFVVTFAIYNAWACSWPSNAMVCDVLFVASVDAATWPKIRMVDAPCLATLEEPSWLRRATE